MLINRLSDLRKILFLFFDNCKAEVKLKLDTITIIKIRIIKKIF